MTISYVVSVGDFAVDEEKSAGLSWDEEAIPSDKIDDRTIRATSFNVLDDAFDYANNVLKNHEGDKWLAYVEIDKVETTRIAKLK
jgi:hypothetical protein